MPQGLAALGTFFTSIGTGLGLSAAGAATFAATLTYATVSFALNKALGLVLRRGNTGETRGLEVSYNDSTAPARVGFGEVRVGGVNMIPPDWTSGTDNRYQHQVLAFFAHEIDSFQEFYFDKDTLPTPGSISGNANDGLISTGKYANAAWVRGYRGTTTQTVDWKLNDAFSTEWPSTARGRTWAYVALTYDWGKGKVYRGLPQVTAKIRGAKLYDPRLDSTNGGSGSHRYNDATTWEWSQNPALAWGTHRIASWGFALDPATEVNWASVAAAADICDASVDDKDGGSQARYTINGIFELRPDGLQDVSEAIVDAMMGAQTVVDGVHYCYAGAWTAPTYSIERSDWLNIHKIGVVGGADAGRFNEVRTFYVDPNRNWQRVECYPRRNTTYKSSDYGKRLAIEMEQPFCTDESEAQRKAEFMLRQSRNGIRVVGLLPPRFHKLRTFDTVAVNFDALNWVSKTFRIAGMRLNPDGTVLVTLQEEQEADWTDLDTADYGQVSITAEPAVNPTKPSAITSLSITPRPGALDFAWDEPVVWPRNAYFRLHQASVNSFAVSSVVWQGDAQRAVLTMPNTATWYHWLLSVSAQGSYNQFPGVSSGQPAGALLTDTDNVAPGAATKVVANYIASLAIGQSAAPAITVVASDPGVYEIMFTGRFTVASYYSADDLGIQFGDGAGVNGTFSSAHPQRYPVSALGQVVQAVHYVTFVTTGTGPWTMQTDYLGYGGGNYYAPRDLSMNITVVRR